MPSKRFWAKKNPEIDYDETVKKTKYFLEKFKYKKFIHISSISARCQRKTVYGRNKFLSENLVLKKKKNLVLRLGPLYGEKLEKGVLIDLINSKTVFVNKNSRYSFTSTNWIAKWIIKNYLKKKGLIEIGAKDYLLLRDIKKKLKSKSKFYGVLDNQIILSDEEYSCNSKEVFNFLKKK